MIYALAADGERREPIRTGERGTCLGCQIEVIAHCGEHVAWHWAHPPDKACDPWYEPMTEWHRQWQQDIAASSGHREVIIRDAMTDEMHVADVVTPDGWVIEIQHSGISAKDIQARETFYTQHAQGLVWLFDHRHGPRSDHRLRDARQGVLIDKGWRSWLKGDLLYSSHIWNNSYQCVSRSELKAGLRKGLEALPDLYSAFQLRADVEFSKKPAERLVISRSGDSGALVRFDPEERWDALTAVSLKQRKEQQSTNDQKAKVAEMWSSGPETLLASLRALGAEKLKGSK